MAAILDSCAICTDLHAGSAPKVQTISTPAPWNSASGSSPSSAETNRTPLGGAPPVALAPDHLEIGLRRPVISAKRAGLFTVTETAPEVAALTCWRGSSGRRTAMVMTGLKSGIDQMLTTKSFRPAEYTKHLSMARSAKPPATSSWSLSLAIGAKACLLAPLPLESLISKEKQKPESSPTRRQAELAMRCLTFDWWGSAGPAWPSSQLHCSTCGTLPSSMTWSKAVSSTVVGRQARTKCMP
mmetsp:Transcript_126178/g.327592  ORF Transcript_126178/g.327592 Transcript_126178/m.327592 type:complete len:241 (-) Transcript_126178:392-1114(-)